jgi:hemerythrin-like metal-binding protein
VADRQDLGRRQAMTLGTGALGGLVLAGGAFRLLGGSGDGDAVAEVKSAPAANTVKSSAAAPVSLRVGYREVDSQHELIVELVDALEWTMTAKARRPAQQKALLDLVAYVKVHYAFEEALMDAYSVTNAAKHKQLHTEMLEWVGGFVAKFADGTGDLTPTLIGDIRHWLEVHITTNDTPMAKELLAKGVRSAL